jgi:hypothetical protein
MHGVGNGSGIPSNSRSLDQQQRHFEATMAVHKRLHPNGLPDSSRTFSLVLNKLCGNKVSVFSELLKSYQAMSTQEDFKRKITTIESDIDNKSTNKNIDTGTLLLNNAIRSLFGMIPRTMFLAGKLDGPQLLNQLGNLPLNILTSSSKTVVDTTIIKHITPILSSLLNTGNETNTSIQVSSAIFTTIMCQPLKICQANLSAGKTPSEAIKMTVEYPFKGLSTSIKQTAIWWTTFSIARENDISQNDAIFLATAASTPDGAKSMMDAVKGTTTWRTFLSNLNRTQVVGLAGMVLSSYLASKAVGALQKSFDIEEILKSMESNTLDENLAQYLDEPHNLKFD